MKQLIFDIGMYDGTDTAYYLESGFRVIAVEANPDLISSASRKFAAEISSGQLTCVNAAVSPDGQAAELHIYAHDLGSSSVLPDWAEGYRPVSSILAPGVGIRELFQAYGMPEYLKIDIEGADRHCLLPLTSECCPRFVSFEAGPDCDELISYLQKIGYRQFKVISQTSFRELANERCWRERVSHRLMHVLGYREPRFVRRAGRFFAAPGSSGPLPWRTDGRWWSGEAVRSRLAAARNSNSYSSWYDVHAAL